MFMRLLVLAIIIMSSSIVVAQEIKYEKDYMGRTVAKDQYGNIIALGEKDYSGAIVWKDKYGNVIKKETIDYLGRLVAKDEYGNVISRTEKNYLGQYEEKDQYGNVVARYERNYLGQIIKKDKYGNTIGNYNQEYDGSISYNQGSNSSGSYTNPRVYSADPNSFSKGFNDALNTYSQIASAYGTGNINYNGVSDRIGNKGVAIGLGFISGDEGGISANGEVYLDVFSFGFKYNLMSSIESYDIGEEYIGTIGLKIYGGVYIKAGLGTAIYNEPSRIYDNNIGFIGYSEEMPNESVILIGLSLFNKGLGIVGWSPELFYSNQTGIGVGINLIF